eukprot:c4066_g1_i1.p1 GENE.c4066_g1_i1~~c4066_g1_i1.p1  ORF type:complete len:294 (+),score=55.09 c4066_g1_i1:80-961(+)
MELLLMTFSIGLQTSAHVVQTTFGEWDFAEEVLNERKNGTVYLFGSDLELTNDHSRGYEEQMVGLRFQCLGIPHGIGIESAFVQFRADTPSSGPISIDIFIENSSFPFEFGRSQFNVSRRNYFSDFVVWEPPDWQVSREVTARELTQNIRDLVQLVVLRSDWTTNSSIVLAFRRSPSDSSRNTRIARSGRVTQSEAPVLKVTFSETMFAQTSSKSHSVTALGAQVFIAVSGIIALGALCGLRGKLRFFSPHHAPSLTTIIPRFDQLTELSPSLSDRSGGRLRPLSESSPIIQF